MSGIVSTIGAIIIIVATISYMPMTNSGPFVVI
jgi:hypothetical protein